LQDVVIVENGLKPNSVQQDNEYENVAFSEEADVKRRDLSQSDGTLETNTYEN